MRRGGGEGGGVSREKIIWSHLVASAFLLVDFFNGNFSYHVPGMMQPTYARPQYTVRVHSSAEEPRILGRSGAVIQYTAVPAE